jgi:hypothetical protein
VGAPKESAATPAADAAVVSPETFVRRGRVAANRADLNFVADQIETDVLLQFINNISYFMNFHRFYFLKIGYSFSQPLHSSLNFFFKFSSLPLIANI